MVGVKGVSLALDNMRGDPCPCRLVRMNRPFPDVVKSKKGCGQNNSEPGDVEPGMFGSSQG